MAGKAKEQKQGGAAAQAVPADVAQIPFEKALDELERIVEQLEEGSLSLEDALSRFERGIHLSRHLEKQLREAEARVQRLVGGETDQPILAPFQEKEDQAEEEDDDRGGSLF
ncbi:MAG TPA: exodeoxyribonuclease VII small subunit [Candidatus Eisenbacteria bacterium]|nr:exodeoxyribonuclease VII small subunit [Candidatus Eisenbacteria bacterium]